MQDFSAGSTFSITLHTVTPKEIEILTHHWEIKITVITFLKELHKNLNHWVIKVTVIMFLIESVRKKPN